MRAHGSRQAGAPFNRPQLFTKRIGKNAMKSTNRHAPSCLGAEPATVWRNKPIRRKGSGPDGSWRNKPTVSVHGLYPRRHQRRAPGGAPARLDADEPEQRHGGERREHQEPGLVAAGELLRVAEAR